MKKSLILLTVPLLLIPASCVTKKATLKIKAGIVTKSGDIKTVARQEFIITEIDILKAWANYKEERDKTRQILEEKIKLETDFNKKIEIIDIEQKRHLNSLSEKTGSNNPIVKQRAKKLAVHLRKIIDKPAYFPVKLSMISSTAMEKLKKENVSYQDTSDIIKELEESYWENINYRRDIISSFHEKYDSYKIQITKEYLKEFEILLADLQKIKEINSLDNEIRAEQEDISRYENDKKKLFQELEDKIENSFGTIKNELLSKFINKINDSLIEKSLTNLNGEAIIEIKKGIYFIFCNAHVGEEKMSWNMKMDIDKEYEYIELSNDNASHINNEIIEDDFFNALKKL